MSWLSISAYRKKGNTPATDIDGEDASAAQEPSESSLAAPDAATPVKTSDPGPDESAADHPDDGGVLSAGSASPESPDSPASDSKCGELPPAGGAAAGSPASPAPAEGAKPAGLSTAIYSWFSSERKKKVDGSAVGDKDAACNPCAAPLEQCPLPDPAGKPKARQSSFWFSYSSPPPSAAETMASLGAPPDLQPTAGPTAGSSLLWIMDAEAPEESKHSDMPSLRSMMSAASLDEVTAGEKGKYFSLVECHDVSDHDILCCSCNLPVKEYIVLAEDGSKWHAKCFATAVCPDEGDGEGDTLRSSGGEDDCADLFDTPPSSPAARRMGSGISLDQFSDGDADLCQEEHAIDMAQAISWAVSEDVSRMMEAGRMITQEISMEEALPAPCPELPDADLCSASASDAAGSDGSPVGGEEAREDGGNAGRRPVTSDEARLEVLLLELHTLGLFEHNYCPSDPKLQKSPMELEKEADEWACKVGNTVDRSLGVFPLAMFQSKEKYTGGTEKVPLTCLSHAATIMHCIRLKFGITMQEYASSFAMGEVEGGDVGEGKSGKRLWYTKDRRFVIKVLGNREFNFLIRIMPSYYNHMISNGSHTLICRFMGLYTVTFGRGYPTRLVVMNNVFYHPPNPMAAAAFVVMDEIYDLKGSAIGRCVTEDDVSNGVSVMKDLNFCENHNGTDTKGRPIYASDGPGVCRKLPLDAAFSAMLKADIENDCAWLAETGIMDYSLLVGKGHLEFGESGGGGVSVSDERPPLPPTDPAEAKSAFKRANSRKSKKNISVMTARPHPLCREDSLHSSFQEVLQTVPWRSVWQEHWGGVSCIYTEANLPRETGFAVPSPSMGRRKITAGEPAILYLGIVDILQEYNLFKRIETAYKMKLLATLGHDPNLISAIDSLSYAERFTGFIESHLS